MPPKAKQPEKETKPVIPGPMVGAEISVTMHIGAPETNEYIRFRANIEQVDTSLPFEEQLNAAFGHLQMTFTALETIIEQKVNEHLKRG